MSAKTFSNYVIFLSISLILLLCFENVGYALVLDKEAQKQTEYVPGQIIVKLKEDKGAKTLFTQTYSVRAKAQNTILSSLKSKYNLKSEKPVFQSLHKQLKSRNLSLEKFEANQLKSASFFKSDTKTAKTPDLLSIYTLNTDQDVSALCAKLKQDPDVEYAEPNYIYKVQMVPNDPYYSSSGSWGQSYDDLWGIKRIQCEQAWDISQGEGVVVAVIDTGVDYNHPDFFKDDNGNGILDPGEQYNIWINKNEIPNNGIDDDGNGYIDDVKGWDFATYGGGGNDNDPMDGHGHGTHVSGTIAAIGNNNIGIIGAAPRAKIMVVKGLNNGGAGYLSDLANCVIYATDNGAKVLSNSWGGACYSQLLTDVFNYAYNQGCLPIAAAGNADYDVASFSPASISTVMAVGASDPNDEKASFSNHGKLLAVSAPGVDILSLRAQGTDMYHDGLHFVPRNDSNAKYYRASGTSMACPHVSGLAALVWSSKPYFSNIDVRNAISLSSDDLGEAGKDLSFGWGRINAQRALQQEPVPMIKVLNVSPKYLWLSGSGLGETLSFSIEITNEWVDAQDVIVSVSTNDERVRIDNCTAAFGNLASGEIKSNTQSPLSVTVLTEVNADVIEIPLIVEITTVDGGKIVRNRQESIYLVPSSVEGSPFVSLEGPVYRYAFKSGRAVADLDGDGTNEMVIASGWPFTKWVGGGPNFFDLFVFNNDGTVRTGWPIHLEFTDRDIASAGRHPALADIDGDGQKEIIISVITMTGLRFGGEVRVYRLDGSMYPGWPKVIPGENAILYDPIVGDINNDGFSEILVNVCRNNKDLQDNCYIFHHDGSMVSGWPYTFPLREFSLMYPTLGDVDGDGYKEIVAGTKTGKIHIIGHNGQLKRLIDANPEGSVARMEFKRFDSHIILANLDVDSEPEIIFSFCTNRLFAYNADGTSIPGWPVSTNGAFFTQIIGDLNADYAPEIVAISYLCAPPYTYELYVFDQNGLILPGFPKSISRPVAPLLADVNNDGSQDIIYNIDQDRAGDVNKVYAIDYQGQVVDGFPKIFKHSYNFDIDTGPSVSDFNNDGMLDLLVNFYGTLGGGGGSIYVVPLTNSGTFPSRKSWPMFLHDNNNTSCYELNRPPDISGIPSALTKDEGSTVTNSEIELAQDPDGDALTYTYSGWTTTLPYTIGYDQAGPHTLHVEVSDATTSVGKDITITVNNINRPPLLDPIGNQATNENQQLQFTISAVDLDNDPLIYSATNLPQGAVFNSETHAFTWTPTYKQAGNYTVSFTASDGSLSDEESIVIKVNNVPIPDLTTGAITYTVTKNRLYTFRAPISNIGDKAIRKPFYVYFYVDGVRKGSWHIIHLAAGRTIVTSFSWAGIKGSHTVKIAADATGRIRESDENNNSAQIEIVVK